MKKSLRIIASAVVIGVSAFGSIASAAPAGKESLDALVTRISSDANLTNLYAGHFAMSAKEVAPYVGSLTPTSLSKDSLFNVFSVQNGSARVEKYLAGEIVFVDENQRPILDAFGNPLVKPGVAVLDTVAMLQEDDDDDDDAAAAIIAGGSALTLGGVATAVVGGGLIAYAASQNQSDDNNPVPEPASLAVMSASIAMFASARRKRNK